jgi:hypothetical protein
MAKRKAARATRRRPAAGARKTSRRKTSGRSRTAPRKTAARKRTATKSRVAAKTVRKAKKSARAQAGRRATARKRPAVKTSKQARPRTKAKAKTVNLTRKTVKVTRKVVVRSTAAPPASNRPSIPVLRKPPSLDRERRVVRDEDDLIQQTPPSSLDLDRSASAVRTGRRILKDKFDEHTETSPALTAGDVDADWESAYSVGDEAPGGDNPTPDQDIVDDIGRAVGVEYQDNEELKGEEKITKRDRNRWELDPASSDDWDDR